MKTYLLMAQKWNRNSVMRQRRSIIACGLVSKRVKRINRPGFPGTAPGKNVEKE